ncbi:hypothetical protein OG555_36580 [Kribbella sp. NBC_01484]|uniref:hypothetical protein n=1 Tax=Kribbella sp. NBC_01484 TaxID=2903579 RepID=UPI002E313812|nr:hypothetical protein [Kribbella sp. NBC_01484]
MKTSAGPTADDRVLVYTRVVSLCIVPFLVAGFVILYLFPQHTARLWAWPLHPTMTAMVLASAYLGGAYFFVRAAVERRWHVLSPGFLSVTLFATLLGVATVLQWNKFTHDSPAFWIWSALYFTAPLLVLGAWLANRRYADPASGDLVAPAVRAAVTAIGVLALIQGAAMFISPSTFLDVWPWTLTPLSCRTLAAVCCLGGAGIGIWSDPRWSTLRRMLEVEILMVGSILLATLRAHDQLDSSKPLAWPLLVGFSLLFFASIIVWSRHSLHRRRTLDHPAPIA